MPAEVLPLLDPDAEYRRYRWDLPTYGPNEEAAVTKAIEGGTAYADAIIAQLRRQPITRDAIAAGHDHMRRVADARALQEATTLRVRAPVESSRNYRFVTLFKGLLEGLRLRRPATARYLGSAVLARA